MIGSHSPKLPKPSSSQLFNRSATILKLTGLSLVAITLLNYTVLFIPPRLTDAGWWFRFTSQLIEQGIIPLLGVGVFFVGIAIELFAGTTEQESSKIAKTERWVYRLALLLGILFGLLAPVHGLAAIVRNQASIAELEERLAQQNDQVKFQLDRQRELYTAVLDGKTNLEDLVGEEPLNDGQLEVLEKIKSDPKALDRQLEAAQTSISQSIQKRASEARTEAKFGVWKSIFRLGLTSWMLAGCYLNVAWMGLKGNKPKNPQKQAKFNVKSADKPTIKTKIKRQKDSSRDVSPGDFL